MSKLLKLSAAIIFSLALVHFSLPTTVKAQPACSGDFTMDRCDTPVNAGSSNSCSTVPKPHRCDFSSDQGLSNLRLFAMSNCATGGAGAAYDGYWGGRYHWHDFFGVLSGNAGTTFTATAEGFTDETHTNRCTTNPNFTVTVNAATTPTPTPTPTPIPIPCPYNSLQARYQVSLDDGLNYQAWTQNLNINQWQTGDVRSAGFFDGVGCPIGDPSCDNPNNIAYVAMDINGSNLGLPPNPQDVGESGGNFVSGVGTYTLTVRGIGACSSLSDTATLNVLYCPYKEVVVNSNRGRPCTKSNPNCAITDPWLTDITVNKKDVKEGRVLSGTYYNNGDANAWADLTNLIFTITKPSAEKINFNTITDPANRNPHKYRIPPSWYTSGLYLNYPGTFTLKAQGTNNGASCGDYPPKAVGHINVNNCSYDSTVAGFQEVANPPKTWSDNLYVQYTGTTVKSAGFHDWTLSSIDPNVEDIKIYTPAEQVILRIVGPTNFDQRADQGAPFTYSTAGDYTLTVTTPNLDTSDPTDIEDGPGCSATASLHVGATPPITACVETPNKIDCCPFTLTTQSLWNGLVSILSDAITWIGQNNSLVPFKLAVLVDKVEFSADRIAHANYLFGTIKEEVAAAPGLNVAQAVTTKTFEPGILYNFSPPGELEQVAGLNSQIGGDDTPNIERREERVSWDISLEGDATPLRKGDMADIDPSVIAGEQLQKYLTRLPGDITGSSYAPGYPAAQKPPQSSSAKALSTSPPTQAGGLTSPLPPSSHPASSSKENLVAGTSFGLGSPAKPKNEPAKTGQVLAETDPYQCIGESVADYMNAVVAGAGNLSKVKLLSPAFNMTSDTFKPIVDAMIAHGANFGGVVGIAGNIYNDANQTISHYLSEVYQKEPSFNGRDIFLTETGDYPGDSLGQADLKTELAKLQTDAKIKTGLLFNAFNTNSGFTQFALNNSQIQDVCSGSCGKIGVNAAMSFFQSDDYYDRAQNLGMTYNLEIAFEPANLETVIQGIQKAQSRGLTPILRICSGSSCGFSQASTYVDFLKAIDADARVAAPVYALAGPNEPDNEAWIKDCGLSPVPRGPSCAEKLVRPRKEVECYENEAGGLPGSQLGLDTLLRMLGNASSLVAKMTDLDVVSRTLVGDVTSCDTNGRGCTDTDISQNAGAFDLAKVPGEPVYKNIATDGKTSPIRFSIEAGGLLMAFLAFGYGIPLTGSGTIPADQFNPDLHDCSIVYTGPGVFPEISPSKLSCTYVISNPEVKWRYFGAIQSALFNLDTATAPAGVQCKLDVPGGDICATQASTSPIITPPPTFTGECTLCNFPRGSTALRNLLDEVGNAVKTPASVLAGMLNFEGYVPGNPDPNKRHIFNYTDTEINEISTPGVAMPYCAESYAGARGPCQFMPSQWETYKNTVNSYFSPSHTPEICNLRDCLYAAGAKMREDAGRLGNACGYDNAATPPTGSCNWTGPNAAKSAYHYYGACSDNYVATVVNYYYNYTCQP